MSEIEILRRLQLLEQIIDRLKVQEQGTGYVKSIEGDSILPALIGNVILGEGNGIDIQVSGQTILINAVLGSKYYLNSVNSSDIAGYESLTQTFPGNAKANVAVSVTGANIALEEFATEPALPGITVIPGGIYNVHIHGLKGTAGNATIKALIYKRASGGAETLVATTESSTALTTSELEFNLHVTVADTALLVTDRLVVKVVGDKTGGGADPTVTIYYDGDTDARLEFPSASGGLVLHNHESNAQGGKLNFLIPQVFS